MKPENSFFDGHFLQRKGRIKRRRRKKRQKSGIGNKNRESPEGFGRGGGGVRKKRTDLALEQERHNTQDGDEETVASKSKVTKLRGPAVLSDKQINMLHCLRMLSIKTGPGDKQHGK